MIGLTDPCTGAEGGHTAVNTMDSANARNRLKRGAAVALALQT